VTVRPERDFFYSNARRSEFTACFRWALAYSAALYLLLLDRHLEAMEINAATFRLLIHWLRCRCLPHDIHVAIHRLCQLRIHLIRDSHDIRQKQAEIECAYIALQHLK